MSVSNFVARPKVPDSVQHLDHDLVVEVLSRHGVNVTEAAGELGVASTDLRRLLWANPKLTDAAAEIEERRLDLAEKNIYEALRSDDPRRRDAASMFTIRNGTVLNFVCGLGTMGREELSHGPTQGSQDPGCYS
jgi:hypothetical protein